MRQTPCPNPFSVSRLREAVGKTLDARRHQDQPDAPEFQAAPTGRATSAVGGGLRGFARRHRCLQIVGPHGCGKSTFLDQWLGEGLSNHRDARVLRIQLCGEATTTPASHGCETWIRVRDALGLLRILGRRRSAGRIMCVDGFERVPRGLRRVIRWIARWRGSDLVVTSHRRLCGFEVLRDCRYDPGSAKALVQACLTRVPDHVRRWFQDRVDLESRIRDADNYRELMSALYDDFADEIAG
ncbi:MAG: hypothetical protein AAF958_10800 [Planctomycetota bacterium]